MIQPLSDRGVEAATEAVRLAWISHHFRNPTFAEYARAAVSAYLEAIQAQPPEVAPELPPGISCDPDIMDGEPCFTGTRIPLRCVVSFHEAGYPAEKIAREYPSLSVETISQAIALLSSSGTGEGEQGLTVSQGAQLDEGTLQPSPPDGLHSAGGEDELGRVTWLSSGEDEGPDVGLLLGLGSGNTLLLGELPTSTLKDAGIDLAVYPDGWWLAMYTKTGVVVVGPVADIEGAREVFDEITALATFGRAPLPASALGAQGDSPEHREHIKTEHRASTLGDSGHATAEHKDGLETSPQGLGSDQGWRPNCSITLRSERRGGPGDDCDRWLIVSVTPTGGKEFDVITEYLGGTIYHNVTETGIMGALVWKQTDGGDEP